MEEEYILPILKFFEIDNNVLKRKWENIEGLRARFTKRELHRESSAA